MKKWNFHFFSEKTGESKNARMSPLKPALWILGAILAALGFVLFSPFELADKIGDGTLLGLRKQNRQIRSELNELRVQNDSAERFLQNTEALQDSIYAIGGIHLPVSSDSADSLHREKRKEALFQTYRTYSVFRDSLVANAGLAKAIPVLHPLKNHKVVTNRFGMMNDHFTEQRLPHRGVDFFAEEGDTVMATGAGKIVEVRAHRGFGQTVKIQHTDHIRTFYAHIEKALVKPGQTVSRGDPIATVGRSGRTAGSGLHYEIRIDGESVDPENYFIQSR